MNVPAKPILLFDCTVKIGDNTYEEACTTVRLDPSTNVVPFQGMKPKSKFAFATPATWAATVAFAQDIESPDALSRYLLEHEGEQVTMEFSPQSGKNKVTATLTIVPGALGGDVSTVPTASVQFPVSGDPDVVDVVGP